METEELSTFFNKAQDERDSINVTRSAFSEPPVEAQMLETRHI